MSDEQRPGRDGPADRDRLDETGQFDPFADEDADSADRPGPDQTAPMPGPDETAPLPGPDETAPMTMRPDQPAGTGGPDQTALLPPTAAREQWAGRAAVRAPGPAAATGREWATVAEEPPPGKWWMPILLGIVALLLLGLLGAGVWLIAQNLDDEVPSTIPTPTAAATRTQPSSPPTTEPTTEEPEPTEEEPQDVLVPPVVGLNLEDAGDALEDAGLTYRVVFRPSDDEPAGTVLGSDPGRDRTVPPGTEVTLYVAAEPTEPTTPTPTASRGADDRDEGVDGGEDEPPAE